MFHRSSRHCSFKNFCSDLIISIDLCSSSLTVSCYFCATIQIAEIFTCHSIFYFHLVLLWVSYFSADTSCFNICYKSIGDCLLEHAHHSCCKVFVRYFQWLDNLNIGVCWLSFPIRVKIFLVIHMLSNFAFFSGHFEYYVFRLWVLFKCHGECWCFCFNTQLIWLISGCNLQSILYSYGFNISSVLKILCVALWLCLRYVPSSGHSGTETVVYQLSSQSLWYANKNQIRTV